MNRVVSTDQSAQTRVSKRHSLTSRFSIVGWEEFAEVISASSGVGPPIETSEEFLLDAVHARKAALRRAPR
jgi:hypothetical protein